MKKIALIAAIFLTYSTYAQVQLKPVDAKNAVSFDIKNFGIKVNGTLSGLKGAIKWDAANLGKSSFDISLDINTINTESTGRDNHLKKDDYFDAAKYPTLNFVSNKITGQANGGFLVEGKLTIKDVTKAVSIPFTVKLDGNAYIFSGTFAINRRDYGIGGSSISMSDDVNVALLVKAVE